MSGNYRCAECKPVGSLLLRACMVPKGIGKSMNLFPIPSHMYVDYILSDCRSMVMQTNW